MTDRGTIKLPRDRYEHHNERRKQAGLSWGEYVDAESVVIEYDIDIDPDAIAQAVAERIDEARIDYAAIADSVTNELESRMR